MIEFESMVENRGINTAPDEPSQICGFRFNQSDAMRPVATLTTALTTCRLRLTTIHLEVKRMMEGLAKYKDSDSNLVKWAYSEFERLGWDDDGMNQMMAEGVMEIVQSFSNHGHSGFSANYAANLINRLLRWKPISELTGDESEWEGHQNKRYPGVFRNDDGTAYWIEGRIFSDDGGETWFTSRDSFVDITFPWFPPESPEKVLISRDNPTL